MKKFSTLKLNFKVVSANPTYQSYSYILIPVISLVLCVLIAILITIPQVIRIFETTKQIDDLKSQQTFFKNKIASLQKVDIPSYRRNLDTALIAMPTDRDIPSAIADVLNLLSTSGLQMLGITFTHGVETIGGIESMQMRLDVLGDYRQLKNFIEISNTSTRILKIDSIEIASSTSTNRVQATLSLLAFFQPIPPNVNLPLTQSVSLFSEEDRRILSQIRLPSSLGPSEASGSADVGKANPFN